MTFFGDTSRWMTGIGRVDEGVRGVEREAHVPHDAGRHRDRDGHAQPRRLAHHGREVLPGDELHGQVELAGRLVAPEVEDLADVGVVQRGGDARLVEEHLHEVLVPADVGEDLLERDELPETARPGEEGEEELGHAPDGDAR
ncbi:MAG: hypothetical protein IT380_25150, partial [Myxococcales bacterium]|nr:hypothetical protein [Myxococcales bacterium]